MPQIASAGNFAIGKLPFLFEFFDKAKNRNELCYNHVCEHCSMGPRCSFKHARPDQIPNVFAQKLCTWIKPGIGAIMANGLPKGSSPGRNKRQRR